MVLAMSRPHKHRKTGVYYFRRAVPADLREAEGGKREIMFSLGTKDPREALRLHLIELGKLDERWRSLRAGRRDLSRREAVALAGEWYRWFIERQEAVLEDNPDAYSFLHDALDLVRSSVRGRDEFFDESRSSFLRRRVHDHLIKAAYVPEFLSSRCITLTEEGQAVFLDLIENEYEAALYRLGRYAAGDFTADPHLSELPAWEQAPTCSRELGLTLTDLLERWWIEAKATGKAPSTYQSYSGTVAKFIAFVGHQDARRVTPETVVAFKDHRLAQINPRTGKPVSPKTVKDSDLAALKSIFGWAVANRLLPENPAEGITIKGVGRPVRTRSKGYTDDEAAAVLRAAFDVRAGLEDAKTHAAKRWVPWLCAYTGARVGEVAQLRKQDLRRERDGWIVIITPEAGTVKGKQAREVPLHPHLIELGFPEFVRASPEGHLFVRPGRDGDVLGPLKGLKNRLREFVREIVPDERVQPFHAWRHRFKTVSRELGIDPMIIDAIQGHTSRSVSDSYGEATIKAMRLAIERHPRFEITDLSQLAGRCSI